MTDFEQYLALYEIDPVRLFRTAKVRYLIIYNAQKGKPITPENAQKIKDAVLQMSGVPYVGSFVLLEPNNKPFLTIRTKQFPKNQQHS
jgi:hypothetical protein